MIPAAVTYEDRVRAADCFGTLPASWQGRLMAARRQGVPALQDDELIARVLSLVDCARGGIRLDAGDHEVCTQADLTARDFERRLRRVAGVANGRTPEAVVRLQTFWARHLMRSRGLLDLFPKSRRRGSALLRLCCARWWRRAFRKLLARTAEACAIDLGIVSRTGELYVSDESVRRYVGQIARTAAVMESVTAVNDLGQDYKLAELAAKGTANKEIRRSELMTRIAGFELIAKDCSHLAFMVTVSCPSRFHQKTTRAGGRVIDNPKRDGSKPDKAQKYLSKQWSLCRSAAMRAGLEWYGFRIAEPQQDGTPHWHLLLFMPHSAGGIDSELLLKALFRRYFLDNESPDEAGAQKHRCDFRLIDWQRGSATGYVIKYVCKNVDGYGVGRDLYGNDAITVSTRVQAWASTHRIRQFQQLGGAPVGVWRELRRVHPEQLQAGPGVPEPLRVALVAVNEKKPEAQQELDLEPADAPSVGARAWATYTQIQGGISCRRKSLRVKLHKETTGEIGRYGEVMPARAVGVAADGIEFFKNHIHEMNPGAPLFQRRSSWEVKSERAEWRMVQGATAIAQAKEALQRSGEAASTRIHVNNCTAPDPSKVSSFAPRRRVLEKLRRFVRRDPPPGRPPGTFGELNA